MKFAFELENVYPDLLLLRPTWHHHLAMSAQRKQPFYTVAEIFFGTLLFHS